MADPDRDFYISEATDIAATCETPKGFAELQLITLAHFVGTFSNPALSFGQWSQSNQTADGMPAIPSYHLSKEAMDFRNAVCDSGWMSRFDWPEWMATPEAKALFASPAGVTSASKDDLERMLTALVRGERFSAGTLGDAFDKGILTAIVKRAQTLLSEGKTCPSSAPQPA